MYFDLQGVNSFVRESRMAVIRELLNLQEMVDAIMAGKMIEGTVSKGAYAAEDGNYGDEMAAFVEENGEALCSDRGPNKEEIRDEELRERSPNEEEIRGEVVADAVKLASANDSKVQEQVSVLSDGN
jgi:hypothetical protein